MNFFLKSAFYNAMRLINPLIYTDVMIRKKLSTIGCQIDEDSSMFLFLTTVPWFHVHVATNLSVPVHNIFPPGGGA